LFLLFKWRRDEIFRFYSALSLSLLLLLRGGCASREPRARESSLKRALFFFFLSSFEQRSVLLLLLFCSEERSATKQKQQREQNLDSSFLWQNTKFFCKTGEKEEKISLIEKGASQKKHRPKITRHVLQKKG